jgi:hypothetical protein
MGTSSLTEVVTAITLLATALFAVLVAYVGFKRSATAAEQELAPIQEERKQINSRLSSDALPTNVIDTIQLGLNQLNEYYVINKSQGRSSFYASMFAIMLGFITIIASIAMFYLAKVPNLTMAAISTLSGIIIQFIGAAYFYVYRKSIEQMNLYFDQLTKMQDTMLAVKLAQDLTDGDKRSDAVECLVSALTSRSLAGSQRHLKAAAFSRVKRTSNSNKQAGQNARNSHQENANPQGRDAAPLEP